jgi:hypothetical protein
MAVYVDDMQLPGRAGGHDSAWSHLFADTGEELHAFAAKLRLKREWFQKGKHLWLHHYDVTAGKPIRLGATAVTSRQAGQIIPGQAQAENASAGGKQARPKRHSWEKHDNYHRTCRDCGIKVLARPHPYERRWYCEYTTTDGRCFVADRVPPCEPAAQPPPMPDDERAQHASELDRAAGRAWQQGDLQRAARLIADARALDPGRCDLWDKREATIAAAAPRPARIRQPEPAGYRRTCTVPHPHQDARLAAQRSREIGGTGRCQDGHPVSDLREDVSARLAAAGLTTGSPELARIRDWNRAPSTVPESPQPVRTRRPRRHDPDHCPAGPRARPEAPRRRSHLRVHRPRCRDRGYDRAQHRQRPPAHRAG